MQNCLQVAIFSSVSLKQAIPGAQSDELLQVAPACASPAGTQEKTLLAKVQCWPASHP
tara:strand:- start:161 stop:334 length:174 start_codon:yes stop_codon:yes gene_type:complete